METTQLANESAPADDRDKFELGRCLYCGERCNADATFHHYCRLEYEYEELHGFDKIRMKNHPLSPIETD